ncbi:uncharacterized protein LOC127286371 [Leptopilina boulardi]|uniref:uncharacterized protein LOC127286371 n=1 Tax=Leptopilina boulardi TaxID=63433 RepID=UPI0021F5423C|nr:uncharacterized protein LOC127286371 [Leptopilina boulardi]
MKGFCSDLKENAFVCVAKKMVADYPKIFKDVNDAGGSFGEGYYIAKKKLKNRYDYLLRCSQDNFMKQAKKVTLSNQKRLAITQAGCKNWQPENHPDGESEESITERKHLLQDFALTLEADKNFDLLNHLNATYTAQRLFLNNLNNFPAMSEVITEWPALIIYNILLWHYQKLMDHEITQFTDRMVQQYDKIFTFNIIKQMSDLAKLVGLGLPETPCLLRVIDTDPNRYYVTIDEISVFKTTKFIKAY